MNEKKSKYRRPPPPLNTPIRGREALYIIADLLDDYVKNQLADWPSDDNKTFSALLTSVSDCFTMIRQICFRIRDGKVDAGLAYFDLVGLVSDLELAYQAWLWELQNNSEGLRHLVYEVRRSVKRLTWYAEENERIDKGKVG